MTDFKQILIAGKLPLPVGGVRIHVERLIQQLPRNGFTNFSFFNLEEKPLHSFFLKIPNYTAVHLHTSNTWLQLLVAVYCLLIRKPVIITYHGNWGRFGKIRNLAAAISARLASIPVLQNKRSLIQVKKFNNKAVLMDSFILPVKVSPLSEAQLASIVSLRKRFKNLFCTNAWNVTFDRSGREIYGICNLIERMQSCRNSALIISDPSGNYRQYAERKIGFSAENLLWLSEPHDFVSVLKLSDAFIRNTTTDGTSISIQEALWCQIPVFASDVVTRPDGCHLYQNPVDIDFENELEKIQDISVVLNILPEAGNVISNSILLYNSFIV